MQTHPDNRNHLLAWLALTAAVLIIAIIRWPAHNWLSVDFQALLPADDTNHWVSVANDQVAVQHEGNLIWLVESNSAEKTAQFSAQLRQQLDLAGYSDPNFETRQLAYAKALNKLLLSHRMGLLTPEDFELLSRNPTAYFKNARQLMYSPLGGLALSYLEEDPSGLFANYLGRISRPSYPPDNKSTGTFSELLLTNVPTQKRKFTNAPDLYNFYQRQQARAQHEGVQLFATGSPLYTAYGSRSAQKEISTIGMASLMLLVLLLLISLRSLTAVLLTLACVFSGMTIGLLVTVSVFGQIHVLTLVFGASLIGISADYALHYLTHSRSAHWHPDTALAEVYPALRLSTASSVVAFGTLLLLPFPGIQQIGLLMASGLFASFLTVTALFPRMYRGSAHHSPLPDFWSRPLWRVPYIRQSLLALMLLAVAALSQLPTSDDVRAFYAAPQELLQAQEKIANKVSRHFEPRYLLLQAPDINSLLTFEAQLSEKLQKLEATGALATHSGISTLIPTAEAQEKSSTLLKGEAFSRQLKIHMDFMGLDEQQQKKALDSLAKTFSPLDIEAISSLNLPLGVGGFLGCNDTECASRITLGGLESASQLEALASSSENITLVDQLAFINATMATYRVALGVLLVVATLLITLLLGFLHGWRLATGVVMTPLASCLFTLAAVGYWQGGLNLANIMALLLLVGVSLDYAIFRSFCGGQRRAATTLAISLSAATSILAFGMLGFSETPIIRSFGQTIAVGLFFAWLLSWTNLAEPKDS